MEFTEEKVLQKGVRLVKLSVDKALLKAKSHAKKGEIEEAQKLYQAILQAFPKNKRAQQGLAALNIPKQPKDTQSPPQDAINQLIQLYNQGHLATIVEQAQILTEQYPEAFIIWNILGAANKGLGRVQAASEAFKKVTELNPAYADGFNNLGASLQDQGKLEEAIVSYNKALSLKPNYADAFYNMGNALKVQGKLEEAIASFNKALSLKPDYAEVHKNLSSLIKYSPNDTQVTLVSEMIQRPDLKDNDRCYLHYTFAKMNEDLGDFDAAYNHYVAGGKLRQKLLSYNFKQDELIRL